MLWLVALVPLTGALLVALSRMHDRATLAWSGCAIAAVAAVIAFAAAAGGWHGQLPWSPAITLVARLPPLSAVTALVVPLVALPVLLYAAVHEHREGLKRLVALLLLFTGAMELVVIAGDLLTLLIGWEAMGACSWALIAHQWRRAGNVASANTAFLVTRFGDLGLFLAAMVAFAHTGSFAYGALPEMSGSALHLFVFGILLSASAKSAQLPFSFWLFQAMDGPTPVSALLHSATMVAAGAFLLAILQPVLDRVEWFEPTAITLGLATALAAGLVATAQPHAKKLLAASTSGHHGLMFVATGAGYPLVAVLYLAAHAFAKAMLFLAAGAAGGRTGTFELGRMGAAMPGIALLSACGALALAGVPPLGASLPKELVVSAAGSSWQWLAIPVMVAGALSACYITRFQRLVFSSKECDRRHGREHGATKAMTASLAFHAAAAAILSLLWIPSVRSAVAKLGGGGLPPLHAWELVISLLLLLGGALTGWRLARPLSGPAARLAAGWFGLPCLGQWTGAWTTRSATTLARWDDRVLDGPAWRFAQGVLAGSALAARMDNRAIDAAVRRSAKLSNALALLFSRTGEALLNGLPDGAARVTGRFAVQARRLQTGLTPHYYVTIATSAAGLILLALLAG
jgi:NADH:ubiquinone oxidoreductase subunit 5 (subunit L)/multisubunit Na+/H+ antiporter MnhA subunit